MVPKAGAVGGCKGVPGTVLRGLPSLYEVATLQFTPRGSPNVSPHPPSATSHLDGQIWLGNGGDMGGAVGASKWIYVVWRVVLGCRPYFPPTTNCIHVLTRSYLVGMDPYLTQIRPVEPPQAPHMWQAAPCACAGVQGRPAAPQ